VADRGGVAAGIVVVVVVTAGSVAVAAVAGGGGTGAREADLSGLTAGFFVLLAIATPPGCWAPHHREDPRE
jgi:hypothetical protein